MTNVTAFNAEKYIEEQSKYILHRIKKGEGRLYLEFGGKLVEDKHAMRVLPGFDENAKIKLLEKMKEHAEIIICIYSGDIISNKTRQDFGITYDLEVMRLIDQFRRYNLSINSVVVTRYVESQTITNFINRLERSGIKTYKHYYTKGYPTDIDTIVSDEGYGMNPYIEVKKPLVVITGPGGGSGKLATSLSQVYHEYRRGEKARYAKFETFPVWNLPLKHPVNIAYEAATVDLKDTNMIDPFHLEAYNETAINYNRDIEAFPVVKRILDKITGNELDYKSPTDMGVNRVGFSIENDEECRKAASQEIVRRYLLAEVSYKKGLIDENILERMKLILEEVQMNRYDRKVVGYAEEYAEKKRKENPERYENIIVTAIELSDGKIITGRSSRRMVASAAMILNAAKYMAGIEDEALIISPEILNNMRNMNVETLHRDRSALNCEEVLLALAITSMTREDARNAYEYLKDLKGLKAHCTAILSERDEQTLKQLGIDITSNPEFSTNNLYPR